MANRPPPYWTEITKAVRGKLLKTPAQPWVQWMKRNFARASSDTGVPDAPSIAIIVALGQGGDSKYEMLIGVDSPGSPANWDDITEIEIQVSTDNTFGTFPTDKSLDRQFATKPPFAHYFVTNYPGTYYVRARVKNSLSGYGSYSTTLTRSTNVLDGLTADTGPCSVTDAAIAVKSADTDPMLGTQIEVSFRPPVTNGQTYFGYTIIAQRSSSLPTVTKLETGTDGQLAVGQALLTDTTKSWGVNDYKNKFLVVFDSTRSGSPSYEFEGQIVMAKILSNTSTAITFNAASQNLKRAQTGLTYFIVDESELFWSKCDFVTPCILDPSGFELFGLDPSRIRSDYISPSFGYDTTYVWIVAYNVFGTGPVVATTPTNANYAGMTTVEHKDGSISTAKIIGSGPGTGAVTEAKTTFVNLGNLTINLGTVQTGLLRTAASGSRVEVDSTNGIRAYNAAGTLVTQIALSGSGAGLLETTFVSGQTAVGAVLQLTNSLSAPYNGVYIDGTKILVFSGGTDIADFRTTGLDLLSGAYKVGGTAVIDASRNIANSAITMGSNAFKPRFLVEGNSDVRTPVSSTLADGELVMWFDSDALQTKLLFQDTASQRYYLVLS
jgi:hypothetical protein